MTRGSIRRRARCNTDDAGSLEMHWRMLHAEYAVASRDQHFAALSWW